VIRSRIGARVLLVAILVFGVGLVAAAQYWPSVPSILGHFHWELRPPRQLSDVVDAGFGLQLQGAYAFVSQHFHWETAQQLMAVLAQNFVS
jgi:hypothetical protein